MKHSILVRTAVIATAVVALAGCDSAKSTFGLERHVPDETQVVVHPALTLPPEFDLRPPGEQTPVSGAHEHGESMAANGDAKTNPPEKKEKKGFLGRLFTLDFGDDDDGGPAPKAAPAQADIPQPQSESASINGVPSAPPVDSKPQADTPAPADAPKSAPKSANDDSTFFGRLFGDLF